jgi:hypothetical protein
VLKKLQTLFFVTRASHKLLPAILGCQANMTDAPPRLRV